MATADDIPALQRLIIEHARNEWSHPTEDWMTHYFEAIRNSQAWAAVADDNQNIIGAAIFEVGSHFLKYQSGEEEQHGYIAEVVVDGAHAKKGLGTELLRAAIQELMQKGVKTIYAKRHEENAPSARMMDKCGFTVVDAFDDWERTSGSRRTAICQLKISDAEAKFIEW